MAIFANHAHLFPAYIRPDGALDALYRLMEACDIEKVVCFAPFRDMVPADHIHPTEWLAREIAGKPEFVGYAALNPTDADALDWVRRLPELGFRGIKLHPAYDRWDLHDPRAFDLYQLAGELGLVLDFHTGVHGHFLAQYHPSKFDEVAQCRNDLRIVLEHMGGRTQYADALSVMANANVYSGGSRIYAGIASVLDRKLQTLWYQGPERVQEMAELFGADKLIYGLDFPWNGVESVKQDLAIIADMDLGEGGREALLGGNLKATLEGKR